MFFWRKFTSISVFICLLAILPVPILAQDKTGILLVAFGTSEPAARPAFDAIDKAYKQAFPDSPIVWAFTSQIIRKKLAKQGVNVGSISQGLSSLAKKGIKTVRVQSLHVMAGEEFAALARSVLIYLRKHPKQFSAVYLGRPLLESTQDAEEVAKTVLLNLSNQRKPEEAVAFMGHGQKDGRADLVFEGTRSIFKKNDPLAFMATVEGNRNFDDLTSELKNSKPKDIWLVPLMVTAGDHARNDLAGNEPDSWASRLRELGYNIKTDMRGLGEVPGIPEIFIRHTKSDSDNLMLEPRKP